MLYQQYQENLPMTIAAPLPNLASSDPRAVYVVLISHLRLMSKHSLSGICIRNLLPARQTRLRLRRSACSCLQAAL